MTGPHTQRKDEQELGPAAVVVSKAGSGLGLGLGSGAGAGSVSSQPAAASAAVVPWQQIVEINEAHWAKSAKVFYNFSSLCSRQLLRVLLLLHCHHRRRFLLQHLEVGFTFGSATFSDFG